MNNFDKYDPNDRERVLSSAFKIATNTATAWYSKYQYLDLNSLEQAEREKLLDGLLSALAVLLAPYEYNKLSSKSYPFSPIGVWLCATYGWYYYSYQQDKLKKVHNSLLEAGYEPKPNDGIIIRAEKATACYRED